MKNRSGGRFISQRFDISFRNNIGRCLFVKRRWMQQLVVITRRTQTCLSFPCHTFREWLNAFIHLIKKTGMSHASSKTHIFYRCDTCINTLDRNEYVGSNHKHHSISDMKFQKQLNKKRSMKSSFMDNV